MPVYQSSTFYRKLERFPRGDSIFIGGGTYSFLKKGRLYVGRVKPSYVLRMNEDNMLVKVREESSDTLEILDGDLDQTSFNLDEATGLVPKGE